ncbi:Armadillo-like helical [Babesia duncani]|uniref:Armadillo-like helical n=1 Tax=Babesia duncani TaxID=323732 RepID=A0AAD9UN84_9APIC|nr:Armadillo-like helical [Babesia duncani]
MRVNLKQSYTKVVEFLFNLRNQPNNTLENTGRILKCWHKWHHFDNYSNTSEPCFVFLRDCLEIIGGVGSADFEAHSDTFEIAIECMVDVLEEVGYLNYKQHGGGAKDDQDENFTYSPRRHNDLKHIARLCFELCTSDAFIQKLASGFESNYGYLNLISKLHVHLIDALQYSLQFDNPKQTQLLSTLVHFIELPYCLMFSNVTQGNLKALCNCFAPGYNRLELRNLLIASLPQCQGIEPIDDEACGYASSAIYLLYDLLAAQESRASENVFQFIATEIMQVALLASTFPSNGNEPVLERDPFQEYRSYMDDLQKLIPSACFILKNETIVAFITQYTVAQGFFTQSLHAMESGLAVFGLVLSSLSSKSLFSDVFQLVTQLYCMMETLFIARYNQDQPQHQLPLKTWQSALHFLTATRRIMIMDESEVLIKQCYSMMRRLLECLVKSSSDAVYFKVLKMELVHTASNVCFYTRLNKLKCWEHVLQCQMQMIELVHNDPDELDLLLIEGTSSAISTLSQDAVLVNVVETLIMKWLHFIKEGMDKNSLTIEELKRMLNKICTCIRNIQRRNILGIVCRELIPMLQVLLTHFCKNDELVEIICKCLKHAARCCHVDVLKRIPEITATIAQVSQVKLTCTYLYAVEWLHALLSKDSGEAPEAQAVANLYMHLTRHTLQILESPENLKQESTQDLLEDFFGLQTRILKCTTLLLDNLLVLQNIVKLSNVSFGMSQPHCLFSFWNVLLRQSRQCPQYYKVAKEALPITMKLVMGTIASGCHSSVKRCVETFIQELVANFGIQETTQLVEIGTSALPQSLVPNDKERALVVESLVKEAQDPDGIKSPSTMRHIHKLACQIAMRHRNRLD